MATPVEIGNFYNFFPDQISCAQLKKMAFPLSPLINLEGPDSSERLVPRRPRLGVELGVPDHPGEAGARRRCLVDGRRVHDERPCRGREPGQLAQLPLQASLLRTDLVDDLLHQLGGADAGAALN